MAGHCSKCRKVWTLETEQGLCPLCGKLASCITGTQALRSIKSSRKRRQRQALASGNDYDLLEGEWLTYYTVACRFSHRAKEQDRGDLLHDIMLTFAEVARNNGHKPLTEPTMYRIASHTLANYWRNYYRLTHGLDCRWCSEAQRQACKVRISKPFADNLLANCPKAIRLESLSKPIVDAEGNLTELGNLIADDKAIDLAEWVDQKTFLLGCPQRLIAIAQKVTKGEALAVADRKYLWKWRRQEQKQLPLGVTI
jgi:hypothetical protein